MTLPELKQLPTHEEVDALKAQVNCLRGYLCQLAKLGNGERYGNSVGNAIAIEALQATPEKCLAEVKAKAIEEAVELLSCQTVIGHICYSRDLLDQANELREKAK